MARRNSPRVSFWLMADRWSCYRYESATRSNSPRVVPLGFSICGSATWFWGPYVSQKIEWVVIWPLSAIRCNIHIQWITMCQWHGIVYSMYIDESMTCNCIFIHMDLFDDVKKLTKWYMYCLWPFSPTIRCMVGLEGLLRWKSVLKEDFDTSEDSGWLPA